jgi:hypothetical protein
VAKSAARFAHRSEAELAHLFDFFQVDWHYEPQSFPIAWDERGEVVESFTPDFYLPQFDIYVEVTTAAPRFQTRKNRKLRLFRASYPHVRIKFFNKGDIAAILCRRIQTAK